LAKGGFKPVVLERRDVVGGGAVTEEFHPGFRVSSLAHTLGRCGRMLRRIYRWKNSTARYCSQIRACLRLRQMDERFCFTTVPRKRRGGIARISAKTASDIRNSRSAK